MGVDERFFSKTTSGFIQYGVVEYPTSGYGDGK